MLYALRPAMVLVRRQITLREMGNPRIGRNLPRTLSMENLGLTKGALVYTLATSIARTTAIMAANYVAVAGICINANAS